MHKVVTGEHWTEKHRPNSQKLSKKCPKIVLSAPPSNFRTFFRHFLDILSAFPFSGLSNALPVTSKKAIKMFYVACRSSLLGLVAVGGQWQHSQSCLIACCNAGSEFVKVIASQGLQCILRCSREHWQAVTAC